MKTVYCLGYIVVTHSYVQLHVHMRTLSILTKTYIYIRHLNLTKSFPQLYSVTSDVSIPKETIFFSETQLTNSNFTPCPSSVGENQFTKDTKQKRF